MLKPGVKSDDDCISANKNVLNKDFFYCPKCLLELDLAWSQLPEVVLLDLDPSQNVLVLTDLRSVYNLVPIGLKFDILNARLIIAAGTRLVRVLLEMVN